jgi:hypothetical protein
MPFLKCLKSKAAVVEPPAIITTQLSSRGSVCCWNKTPRASAVPGVPDVWDITPRVEPPATALFDSPAPTQAAVKNDVSCTELAAVETLSVPDIAGFNKCRCCEYNRMKEVFGRRIVKYTKVGPCRCKNKSQPTIDMDMHRSFVQSSAAKGYADQALIQQAEQLLVATPTSDETALHAKVNMLAKQHIIVPVLSTEPVIIDTSGSVPDDMP